MRRLDLFFLEILTMSRRTSILLLITILVVLVAIGSLYRMKKTNEWLDALIENERIASEPVAQEPISEETWLQELTNESAEILQESFDDLRGEESVEEMYEWVTDYGFIQE